MDRKRIMEEAIHSGEMEGAYVSAEFRRDAEQYVDGDFTIEELMTRTKRRWKVDKHEPEAAAHA
ncbi:MULTISPECIES: antitoxin VbhA family protein [Bifidobacterium]|uniref:antitoxin VbhA family protein n=1 Tax=Bifidobacterium TaxID=1678 RepID=UPI001BDDB203|nr:MULTISPECIES: antitoxin VbhA family protein [Bifidobacterium]MBT1160712.1 hypothetical protein [Bifidobacterium sp. SO1]MBW3077871.1 hypothetical protein [Bifidobacterium simiiventris]